MTIDNIQGIPSLDFTFLEFSGVFVLTIAYTGFLLRRGRRLPSPSCTHPNAIFTPNRCCNSARIPGNEYRNPCTYQPYFLRRGQSKRAITGPFQPALYAAGSANHFNHRALLSYTKNTFLATDQGALRLGANKGRLVIWVSFAGGRSVKICWGTRVPA